MKFTAALGAFFLLGAAQAQTVLRQCAVQGDGGYNVPKTHERTSASCAAAGGVLGTTQTGTRAKGLACCTVSESQRGAFNDKCRTYNEIPVGIPQPC